jgi:tetratricopeptide (TPR) repeat protein
MPMLAAIAQQQAHGYALDGDEAQTQRLLDESHQWAATDTAGDAREGHGSFCTASYIELQRAACWLRLGYPDRAIQLYEATLPTLPIVYRRDRGVALSRYARAQLAAGQPEAAAAWASDALHIAVDVGSRRTVCQVQAVGELLGAYRQLPAVAQLLDELAAATAP